METQGTDPLARLTGDEWMRRMESHGRGTAPRDRPQTRFAATEPGETPRAFALDQDPEPFADESGALLNSRNALRLGLEPVVQIDSRAHGD